MKNFGFLLFAIATLALTGCASTKQTSAQPAVQVMHVTSPASSPPVPIYDYTQRSWPVSAPSHTFQQEQIAQGTQQTVAGATSSEWTLAPEPEPAEWAEAPTPEPSVWTAAYGPQPSFWTQAYHPRPSVWTAAGRRGHR